MFALSRAFSHTLHVIRRCDIALRLHNTSTVSPQTASRKSGDCTFEENMCFWTNPLVDARLDDFDWIRQFSYGNFGPKRDNTKKSALGNCKRNSRTKIMRYLW